MGNYSNSPATERGLAPDEWVNIFDRLADDYIPLPLQAMQKLGRTAQTLGAIHRVAIGQQTFRQARVICDAGCIPLRTFRRDVARLHNARWIIDGGRQVNLRTNRCRRTVTYMITDAAMACKKPFVPLPRWAANLLANSWQERAVFACIVGRHLMIERVELDMGGIGSLDGRREYKIEQLMADTGLCRSAVLAAKKSLQHKHLIVVEKGSPLYGTGDELWVNPRCVVRAKFFAPFPDDERREDEHAAQAPAAQECQP